MAYGPPKRDSSRHHQHQRPTAADTRQPVGRQCKRARVLFIDGVVISPNPLAPPRVDTLNFEIFVFLTPQNSVTWQNCATQEVNTTRKAFPHLNERKILDSLNDGRADTTGGMSTHAPAGLDASGWIGSTQTAAERPQRPPVAPCTIFHAHKPAANHADSLNDEAKTGSTAHPRPCWRLKV